MSLLVEMVLDDAVFLNSAVLHVQGDFVDRGFNSLEVFTILLLLKARYLSTFLFGIVNVLFVCSKALTFLAQAAAASLFRLVLQYFDVILPFSTGTLHEKRCEWLQQ